MNKQDEHVKYYNGNGVEVPSCTNVVKLLNKPELIGWANYMGFKRINTSKFLFIKKLKIIRICNHIIIVSFDYFINPTTTEL